MEKMESLKISMESKARKVVIQIPEDSDLSEVMAAILDCLDAYGYSIKELRKDLGHEK